MPEANIPETDDLAEVQSMFPDNILAEVERKAHREGLQEGREEGRHEAEVAVLLRLLERRFGDVSPEIRQRIASADPVRIGQWIDQVIDAPDLATIFRVQ